MRFFMLLIHAAWIAGVSRSLPTTITSTLEDFYGNGSTYASTEYTVTDTETTTIEDIATSTTVASTDITRSAKSETLSPKLLSMRFEAEKPKRQCGRRSTRNARIVGGMDTYEGEFPWAVSVRLVTTHYCGGTILNKFWVLTAAHCVKRYNARYFRVRPGGRRVHLDENLPEWDIHVEEVSLHPDFGHPRRYSNDVALLKLKRPIPFGEVAQPICLPSMSDEDLEGRNATVVGWGWLNEEDKGKSKKLQKVQVPILNNTICAKWYSEEYNGYVQIQDYQICAGYKEGGKDSCQGDSGGPLVMKDKDHYTLIGVVSAGVGCARRHLPGIYSRVSVFVPWITEVIGGLYNQ